MPSNLLEADAKIGRITESTNGLPKILHDWDLPEGRIQESSVAKKRYICKACL